MVGLLKIFSEASKKGLDLVWFDPEHPKMIGNQADKENLSSVTKQNQHSRYMRLKKDPFNFCRQVASFATFFVRPPFFMIFDPYDFLSAIAVITYYKKSDDCWHIESLAVAPAHRKEGLARFLMESLMYYAKMSDVKKLTLMDFSQYHIDFDDCPREIKQKTGLYEKFGFFQSPQGYREKELLIKKKMAFKNNGLKRSHSYSDFEALRERQDLPFTFSR